MLGLSFFQIANNIFKVNNHHYTHFRNSKKTGYAEVRKIK